MAIKVQELADRYEFDFGEGAGTLLTKADIPYLPSGGGGDVQHDTSLTGNGTAASPLGVNVEYDKIFEP